MWRVRFLRLGYVLLSIITSLFILCLLIIACGLSFQTNQPAPTKLTQEHITQARKILYEGTKIKPAELARITLTQADLNLAGNYLLNQYLQSTLHVELVNHKVRCMVSIVLPTKSWPLYFNMSFRLGSEVGEPLPRIIKFKIGELLLPANMADAVIHAMIRYSYLNDYFILATKPIEHVEIIGQQLTIFYDSTLPNHQFNEQSRLIYQQKIHDVITQHDPKWRLSLADLLKPVFHLVHERATLESAIEENRSAILAVNDYVNAESPPIYPAFLYKRPDLAQHFMGAAALTASTNSDVAKVLGEVKELRDSKTGGSGFSFVDLAADKVGSRFGEIAVSSPENAYHLAQFVSQIRDYRDFMPDPRDLPEHMSEDVFKQTFESTKSAAYLALSAQIDARMALIPLYQIPKIIKNEKQHDK
ncbi:MAG: hypothetical protein QG557_800 [Pseudomonadota bacterium]|nr:hypothetical protein [Pseudomonadota bacterium]